MNTLIQKLEGQTRKEPLASFSIGDMVKVHQKIREGDKERIQIFQGTVIAKAGGGAGATFTVRKVSFGVGVERLYPLNSPNVVAVEVVREGRVRRARLYYLRQRFGKKAKVREKKRTVS